MNWAPSQHAALLCFQRSVTILADNDPKDRYYYLLTVLTGWKNQAGTTSVVSFYMTGSDGTSRTHVMMDEDKELFLTGAEDWFLATEPDSLGELEIVNVWIDCTGLFPAWSVFPSLAVPSCCSLYCTVVSQMSVRPSSYMPNSWSVRAFHRIFVSKFWLQRFFVITIPLRKIVSSDNSVWECFSRVQQL